LSDKEACMDYVPLCDVMCCLLITYEWSEGVFLRTAAILNAAKSPYLCNRLSVLAKFGTVMHVGPHLMVPGCFPQLFYIYQLIHFRSK